MIIKTESGSIYEINKDRNKVRRLNNVEGASERAGFNGVWKDCLWVSIGERLIIGWRQNGDVLETTVTSPIVEVEE